MEYVQPASFEDAARIAHDADGTVRFLVGGTDVLVQMRAGIQRPDTLIDLKKIAGTDQITRTADGGWQIGIAVPGYKLGACAELVADYPGIVEGMQLVGSTQVQGRASLVGNLCNASPAADSVPAMVAAGAVASVMAPDGTVRELPVAQVPVAPGRTSLQKGEVITAITLPPRGAGGDCYLRFTPRTEMDIAVVGCAVNVAVAGGKITAARVALGAVAPTVIDAVDAAACLIGTTLDEVTLQTLADKVRGYCKPIDDKRGTAEFRIDIAGTLAQRAARIAYQRATGGAA